jgi:hypothetical protein
MENLLRKLLTAADNHGEDSGELDHTVGDLQDLLAAAWDIMTPSQQRELLTTSAAENIVEAGARDEFDAEALVESFDQALKEMEASVTAAGYVVEINVAPTWHWKSSRDFGETCFNAREDAVFHAHQDLMQKLRGQAGRGN